MPRVSTHWTPLIVFGVLAVTAVVLSIVADRPANDRQTAPAVSRRSADVVAPLPTVPDALHNRIAADAKYVGSETCVECHSKEAETFFRTRHNRSLSSDIPTTLPDADVQHSKSGFLYSSRSADTGLIHSESLLTSSGSQSRRDFLLRWAVGSGRFGHSFLAESDGYLIQSPLTWYATRDCWDMSPGFDSSNQVSFGRSVGRGCLFCHSGIVDSLDENHDHVVIREPAIGCERCHGPGSAHVARHLGNSPDVSGDAGVPAPNTTGDPSIVNPARLDRALSESVCQQCHVQGDVQVLVRGCDIDDFRPGLPLSQFRQEYRLTRTDDMTIVGHVEQLHRSACYQNSQSLTCTTCHDPHADRSTAELSVHFRNTCLSCHTESACGEDPVLRRNLNDRCVTCHMPAAATEVPHVAFTHHRIGIHRPAMERDDATVSAAESSAAAGLTALLPAVEPAADDDRCRGLALLRLYQSHAAASNPATLRRSEQMLLSAWEAGVRDAAVAAALAEISREHNDPQRAISWAQTVLELEPRPTDHRVTALKCLAELHFHDGRFGEALEFLIPLTTDRRDATFWFYRGLSEQNLGRTDDAVHSLQQSIAIQPRNPGAHTALAAIYAARGESRLAESHTRTAEQLSKAGP